jgi:acid stress-induced BolA-like protein IbaG/YrbA
MTLNPNLLEQEISQYFHETLAAADATVIVSSDDNHHFDAIVVTDLFNAKPLLARQKLVYAALGTKLKDGTLHALGLKTYTHAEHAAWLQRTLK